MSNFNNYKLAVESLSGGTNTVRFDDLGMPSVLVRVPILKYSDIISGAAQETLPAFLVDGEEKQVFVSKYQNIVVNDRAYSLPMKDPRVYIDFDTALRVCRNKGDGWHLTTDALWAAIASFCYKNGTIPHGNTLYGKMNGFEHEKGVVTYDYESGGKHYDGRTATGSGPVTWYHNHDSSGIADLCGNVWEWTSGLRLVDGEIQTIPYGDAMKHDCDMSANSSAWKAILPDGSLVAPGTSGTLKLDRTSTSGGIRIATSLEFPTTESEYSHQPFGEITAKSGVNIPLMLKGLGIAPMDGITYETSRSYMRSHGERLSLRGSYWAGGSDASVSAFNLRYPRSGSGNGIGFRSAFYE